MESALDITSDSRPRRGRRRLMVIVVMVVIVLAVGGWLAWQWAQPRLAVPAKVAEQVLFPTYLPDRLPGTFRIVEDSYNIRDKALLFYAEDEAGHRITFAEQAKPDGFDFTAFYQQQMTNIRNLQGVPYPSVVGRVQTGAMLLSIAADKTWLLVSTKTASEADLRAVAERLRRR